MSNHRVRASRNEAGISLVEVIVAIGILGVLSAATMYYIHAVNIASNPHSTGRFNCAAHAHSVIDKILANSGIVNYTAFNPYGTIRLPASPPFSHPNVIDPNLLWPPNLPNAAPPNFPPVLDNANNVANPLLIDGPMRTLNSIYNGDGTVYSQASCVVSSSQISQLVSETDKTLILPDLAPPSTQVQLQLYDLTTGALIPCGTGPWPMWLKPQAIRPDNDGGSPNENGVAYQINGKNIFQYAPGPQFHAEYGFVLTATTTFQTYRSDRSAQTDTCSASERIRYDRDFKPPVKPTIQFTFTGGFQPAGGQANQIQGTLQVTQAQANASGSEPALVTVCRDRSLHLPQGNRECYANSATGPTGPGYQQDIPAFPTEILDIRAQPVASVSETDSFTLPGATMIGLDQWVPCEQVTVCGRPPTVIAPTGGTNPFQVLNNYTNIPSDCVVRVETATMDSAGNLNTSSATPYNAEQDQIAYLDPLQSAHMTTVARPTCGTLCMPNAYWPTGVPYYQMGACCSGAGCVQGMVASPFSGLRYYLSTAP